MNLHFSGHESFHCRSYWLKKGVDYQLSGKSFNDDSAPIHLGVGKNMVASIRHWLRAFGVLIEEDNIDEVALKVFNQNGWDPYLEDEGTLWLLHYWIVTKSYASIYKIIFAELRKKRPLFSAEHFISAVTEKGQVVAKSSLKKDFHAFQRTYIAKKEKDLEESYSGILTELGLVAETKKGLVIEPSKRISIPSPILLFCIMEAYQDEISISFESLYNDDNGVGTVFALSREGLTELLEILDENYDWLTFSNEAGIRELQFKIKRPGSLKVLAEYYES